MAGIREYNTIYARWECFKCPSERCIRMRRTRNGQKTDRRRGVSLSPAPGELPLFLVLTRSLSRSIFLLESDLKHREVTVYGTWCFRDMQTPGVGGRL